jgi:protein gp37
MGEQTGIEWTSATWNPWRGCTKVSRGCDHCYMFRDQLRYGRDPSVVVRAAPVTFASPLKWAEGRKVFTCSWSDWFHADADPWRDDAWEIIRRTPQHTYQILTKRPGRIHRCLPADWADGYPNVWLGVSVEDQEAAFLVRQLRAIPATVRFISAEPLLGPLALNLDGMHWLIAGGESGPDHRPMDLDWARSLRDACQGAGVAFFLKQLGGPASDKRGGAQATLDGRRWTELPVSLPSGTEKTQP